MRLIICTRSTISDLQHFICATVLIIIWNCGTYTDIAAMADVGHVLTPTETDNWTLVKKPPPKLRSCSALIRMEMASSANRSARRFDRCAARTARAADAIVATVRCTTVSPTAGLFRIPIPEVQQVPLPATNPPVVAVLSARGPVDICSGPNRYGSLNSIQTGA